MTLPNKKGDDDFKICCKCGVDRPRLDFHKNKPSKDGLLSKCKECVKIHNKDYYSANKDKLSDYFKDYRANNVEKIAKYRKDYNKEVYKDESKRNIIKSRNKDWTSRNLDKAAARSSRRRSSKLNATPPWLTKELQQEIDNFYWLAKDLNSMGNGLYEVDHIVPLKNKTVCGLNVPWNLQVLPLDVNRSKGNKFNDWS